MAGMLDLRNVFELVIDGLDDRAFAQQQLTATSQLAPNRTRRTNPTRTPRIKTTLIAAAMMLARTARTAR